MKTIIIGAGLSGLSTAYYLEKRGNKDYVLLEANPEVGGLCRTFRKNGFVFDFAPHMFFFGNKEITKLVRDLLGDALISEDRKHGILINGRVVPYPFQYNLYHLDEETKKECLAGAIDADKKFNGQTPTNFYEWIKMALGEGIAKHFMLPYNKKCYCVHPKELTLENLGRYIPRFDLKEIIKGANKDMSKAKVGYNYQFGYNKEGGIDFLPKAIARKIINIKLDEKVTKIDIDKKIVFTEKTNYPFENLVSTMPLKKLVGLIDGAPEEIKNAAKKLRCNTICAIILGVNKPKVSEHQVLYVPQEDVLTYRLSFATNYGKNVAPQGMSSICAEWSYLDDKKISDEDLIERIIEDLIKMGFLKDKKEVVFKDVLKLEHAYVLFDFNRNENLKLIRDYLIKNSIYSVGQFGAWEHSSMDDSILHGKKVVENLL